MKLLSVCLLYYNKPDALAKHIALWHSYHRECQTNIRFVIIDDGSQPSLASDDLDIQGLDIEIYRIHKDIPWNIGGARNLAAHVAKTKWILMQDSDVFLQPDLIPSVLSVCKRDFFGRTVYKFGRVNPSTGRDSPHPGTMMLRKSLYWKIGGCDEDFVGHYGFTDVHFFKQRVARRITTKVKTLSNFKLIEDDDGATTNLDRSNIRNEKLYKSKSEHQRWSTDYLRFKWSRVY